MEEKMSRVTQVVSITHLNAENHCNCKMDGLSDKMDARQKPTRQTLTGQMLTKISRDFLSRQSLTETTAHRTIGHILSSDNVSLR